MADTHPLLILSAFVVIVFVIGCEGLRRLLDSSIERLMDQGSPETSIRVLDKPLTRMLLPLFRQHYLRFMAYEAAGEMQGARSVLDRMLSMRTTPRRRRALAVVAFSFFVDQGDEEAARGMLDEIERAGNAVAVTDCRETFRIVFEGDSSRIEQMESLLPGVGPQMRCKLCYLLERQYRNRGDEGGARRYARLLDEAKRAASPRAA